MSAPSVPLPLFVWPERAEIKALEDQRRILVRRIETKPRRSYKRLELELRLREITERQLRLSTRLKGNENGA